MEDGSGSSALERLKIRRVVREMEGLRVLAIRDFFSFFRSIGLGLAFALAAAILLSAPSQVVELYTSALSDPNGLIFQSAASVLSSDIVFPALFFMAFAATIFITTLLSIQRYAISSDLVNLGGVPRFSFVSLLIAHLLSIVPGIFMTTSLYWRVYDQLEHPVWQYHLDLVLLTVGGFAFQLVINTCLKLLLSAERPRMVSYIHLPGWLRFILPILLLGLFAVTLLDSIANDSFFTQAVSNSVGPLSVILLFLIVIRIFVSMSESVYYSSGVPAGFLVVMALIIVGGLDASSGRSNVRTLELQEDPALGADIAQVFEDWLSRRANRDKFERYPVYVVAAEGGGLYAAEHTAHVLSYIQDRCPAFAQHIFAISAVSGGAVGAAAFNAALADSGHAQVTERCDFAPETELTSEQTVVSERTGEFLNHDFLSPTLWTFLFLDLPLGLLPVQVVEHDRAIALENTFERRWQSVAEKKPGYFEGELAKTWDLSGALPALFLNTTRVGSGRAELVAPMPSVDPYQSASLGYVEPVRLSTAAALSARFPWFSPPAFYAPPDYTGQAPFQMVDGGLFDNSGVDQALAIINLISQSRSADALKYDFRLLIIGAEPERTEEVYGGLVAPLAALNSARENYGYSSRDRALIELCPDCKTSTQTKEDKVLVHELEVGDLPLGWLLSAGSRDVIRQATATGEGCEENLAEAESFANHVRAQNRRNCFSTAVWKQLSN